MDKVKLKTAIAEAKRFLKRANELDKESGTERYFYDFPKQSGAVKRASMDLTRELANLRRSD